jgi:hypothetical protein
MLLGSSRLFKGQSQGFQDMNCVTVVKVERFIEEKRLFLQETDNLFVAGIKGFRIFIPPKLCFVFDRRALFMIELLSWKFNLRDNFVACNKYCVSEVMPSTHPSLLRYIQ